jgi:hypothetical protein
MPLYLNTSKRPITLDLAGERHEIPPGKTCEVPRKLGYAVAKRAKCGLPLKAIEHADTDKSSPPVEPKPLPRRRRTRRPEGVDAGDQVLDDGEVRASRAAPAADEQAATRQVQQARDAMARRDS